MAHGQWILINANTSTMMQARVYALMRVCVGVYYACVCLRERVCVCVRTREQTFPNVILTPHEGFYTREALTRIAEVTLENLTKYQAVRACVCSCVCACACVFVCASCLASSKASLLRAGVMCVHKFLYVTVCSTLSDCVC
jgi:hypothetical protein